MTFRTVIAIILIFALFCAGWWVLGAVTSVRSGMLQTRLEGAVEKLWGGPLVQQAPVIQEMHGEQPRNILPDSSTMKVSTLVEHRRKGLIWYPTFDCSFDATYGISNETDMPRQYRIRFLLPSATATYDAIKMSLGGEPVENSRDLRRGITESVTLQPGESTTFAVAYRTRGLESWRYRVDPELNRVRNLSIALTTNFSDIDYPEGSFSAHDTKEVGEGRLVTWQADDIITSQDFGVVVPQKLNPGPVASRITFFAPVCLLFFFCLVATLSIVCGVRVHPMHYIFISSGFFAFHLLLAYFVDHLDIHLAFLIATGASLLLVTSYTKMALPKHFPSLWSALGQILFLVLFSYSFFFEGITGLTVAIGSVITLAILQTVTAKVDWFRVFKPVSKRAPAVKMDDSFDDLGMNYGGA